MSNNTPVTNGSRPTRLYPEQLARHRAEREAATASADGGKHRTIHAADHFQRPTRAGGGAGDAARELARLGRRPPRAEADKDGCTRRAAWSRQDADGASTSVLGATYCRSAGRLSVSAHLFVRREPLGRTSASLAIGEAGLEARSGAGGVGARARISAAQLELARRTRPSADSAGDERGAISLGLGIGGGGIYRSADRDGDGRRERGLTIDVGPGRASGDAESWSRALLPSLGAVDEAERLVARGIAKTLEAIGKR